MRKMYATLLMAIMLCSFQCKLPTAADDPNVISSLHFTPSAFDSFRRNTEMKYSLKGASVVSVYIVKKDSTNRELLVKTLAEDLNETKGSHSITWIGDTDQRLFAPVGIYFGIVQLQQHRFETIVQVFHF
jgi:hypothetical protein